MGQLLSPSALQSDQVRPSPSRGLVHSGSPVYATLLIPPMRSEIHRIPADTSTAVMGEMAPCVKVRTCGQGKAGRERFRDGGQQSPRGFTGACVAWGPCSLQTHRRVRRHGAPHLDAERLELSDEIRKNRQLQSCKREQPQEVCHPNGAAVGRGEVPLV